MKHLIIVALAASVMVTNANAADETGMHLTGADFLSACSRPDPDWISFCHGYVQAVFDGVKPQGSQFCVPAGTSRAEIVGTVVAYLKTVPDLQSLNATSVVSAVLLKRYPCE